MAGYRTLFMEHMAMSMQAHERTWCCADPGSLSGLAIRPPCMVTDRWVNAFSYLFNLLSTVYWHEWSLRTMLIMILVVMHT